MAFGRYTVYLLSVFLAVACYYVERVHKVHNINLYPDRHAWCEARPIKMVIGHDGCEAHTIDNKVCVGQCFSYTIPKTIPKNIFDDQLTYCDNCRPSNFTWVKVVLYCGKDPEDPTKERQLEKLLQVVQQCTCTRCQTTAVRMRAETEVNHERKHDVPELLTEQLLRIEDEGDEGESGNRNLDNVDDVIAKSSPVGHNEHRVQGEHPQKQVNHKSHHHKHRNRHSDG